MSTPSLPPPITINDAVKAFALADRTEKVAKKMREDARKVILDYTREHGLEDVTNLTMDGVTVNISRPTHTEPPGFDVNRTDEFFEALFEAGFADIADAVFKTYRQFDESAWFDLVRNQEDNRRMRLHFLLEKFTLPGTSEPMAPRVSLA